MGVEVKVLESSTFVTTGDVVDVGRVWLWSSMFPESGMSDTGTFSTDRVPGRMPLSLAMTLRAHNSTGQPCEVFDCMAHVALSAPSLLEPGKPYTEIIHQDLLDVGGRQEHRGRVKLQVTMEGDQVGGGSRRQSIKARPVGDIDTMMKLFECGSLNNCWKEASHEWALVQGWQRYLRPIRREFFDIHMNWLPNLPLGRIPGVTVIFSSAREPSDEDEALVNQEWECYERALRIVHERARIRAGCPIGFPRLPGDPRQEGATYITDPEHAGFFALLCAEALQVRGFPPDPPV